MAHPIAFERVSKRYRLGSKHDSLRDAIPAMVRKALGRNGHRLQQGEFWALRDVNFHVEKGETLGIVGPNGAGKSTVLKLLSRISKETEGTVQVQGLLAALIEVGAGFHQDLTGRENIYLNGTILGLRRKDIDRLFNSIVEFSELGKFLDMPVKRYSSGMAVRLGFSVAAHLRPENLLIDEVLAVGDLSFQQKCHQRILDLKSNGTTMIFISHNLEAVQRLCDRVLLLQEGQVVRDGEPGEILTYYRQEVLQKRRFEHKRAMSIAVSHASNGLEVNRIRLLNASGEPTETVQTGYPLRIELSYTANRTVRDPAVTVTLERIDGLVCHETSTRSGGLTWDAWQGAGTLALEYPEVNLLPNTYQAIVTVAEGQNPVPVAQMRNQAYFHVTSDRYARGTVHLEHQWINHVPAPSTPTRTETA